MQILRMVTIYYVTSVNEYHSSVSCHTLFTFYVLQYWQLVPTCINHGLTGFEVFFLFIKNACRKFYSSSYSISCCFLRIWFQVNPGLV